MKVSLSVKPQWRRVQIGGDHFEVEVTPPTFEDKMRQQELALDGSGYIEHELRTTITGWRGLEDEDGRIPFEWDALGALCVARHDVYLALVRIASEAYAGTTEEAAKNSEPPLNEPSGEAS